MLRNPVNKTAVFMNTFGRANRSDPTSQQSSALNKQLNKAPRTHEPTGRAYSHANHVVQGVLLQRCSSSSRHENSYKSVLENWVHKTSQRQSSERPWHEQRAEASMPTHHHTSTWPSRYYIINQCKPKESWAPRKRPSERQPNIFVSSSNRGRKQLTALLSVLDFNV